MRSRLWRQFFTLIIDISESITSLTYYKKQFLFFQVTSCKLQVHVAVDDIHIVDMDEDQEEIEFDV